MGNRLVPGGLRVMPETDDDQAEHSKQASPTEHTKEGRHMFQLIRRLTGRRRMRPVRRKLANARRIDASTTAMLARRAPGRTPR
jgi:hypothetical protein